MPYVEARRSQWVVTRSTSTSSTSVVKAESHNHIDPHACFHLVWENCNEMVNGNARQRWHLTNHGKLTVGLRSLLAHVPAKEFGSMALADVSGSIVTSSQLLFSATRVASMRVFNAEMFQGLAGNDAADARDRGRHSGIHGHAVVYSYLTNNPDHLLDCRLACQYLIKEDMIMAGQA